MASNNKSSKPTSKSVKKPNNSKKVPSNVTKPDLKQNKISSEILTKPNMQQVKAELSTAAKATKKEEKLVTSTDNSNSWEFLNDESFQKRAFSIFSGTLLIVFILSFSFVYIPHVLDNTDEAIAARTRTDREEEEKRVSTTRSAQILEENSNLKIDSTSEWKIAMDVKDFGVINLTLKKEYAPATVENFVRLVSRKFYNGNRPHRIVEVNNFKVLQGGDPKENGSGGETASGNQVPDEIWLDGKAPQFKPEGNTQVLANVPELRAPSLYSDFSSSTGQITYRKGLILMAKTSAPNSATSQYFITLDTTILPADYTVFGTVDNDSLAILDKISSQVDPILTEGADPAMGGKPNPELTTTTVKIVSQF